MKKYYNYIYIAGLFILASCASETKTKKVDVKNLYSIEVPDFLTEDKTLNDEASLQYQNAIKEFYIIAIDETKSEFCDAITENAIADTIKCDLKGYADILVMNFGMNIENSSQTDLKDAVINGLKAKTITMEGKYDNVDVFVSFAFIEGKNNYYQIMTWTLIDRKEKFQEQMNTMINSFKEI